MKLNLYGKFILAYLLFGILAFLYVHIYACPVTLQEMERREALERYAEAVAIADTYGITFYTNQISSDDLYTNLKILNSYTSNTIWFINPDGSVLLVSAPDTAATLDSEADSGFTISEFDPASFGNTNYLVGNFYGHFSEDMLSVSAPITSNFETRGYVVIHTPCSRLADMQLKIRHTFYLSLGITLLLSLTIMLFFARSIFKPLKKIRKATREYAKGNLEYRIEINSKDEIGQLASSLNYMSKEIAKSDDFQRKFVANISHDFRSPLTSIKGYAQAMMDGIIEPEQHEKYLNIIISETERLQNLTESILTLNRYDSNSLTIEKTPFDINGVIRNTAALFEGKCKPKRISIQLILCGQELNVFADKGKIQQVIYNLVDNAIKFSHQNSKIIIETAIRNEKVFVSVKDSGIGIPKESLPEVWNRFYKTDLSRGKDKKGSGLGLSITREIIYAHGETIDVISTEGVGSEFVFSLEKAQEKGLDLL